PASSRASTAATLPVSISKPVTAPPELFLRPNFGNDSSGPPRLGRPERGRPDRERGRLICLVRIELITWAGRDVHAAPIHRLPRPGTTAFYLEISGLQATLQRLPTEKWTTPVRPPGASLSSPV